MPYETVTRADFRTSLRQRLGSRVSAAPFWADETLHLAITESLRTWNLLTGYWSAKVVLQLDANQVWVPVAASLTMATRVTWQERSLLPSSLPELDRAVRGWETAPAAARPKVWAPAGLNLIAIWPPVAMASRSLLADGVRATPTLASDASTVDLGSDLFEVLLNYACHLLAFIPGNRVFQDSRPARQALWAAAADENQRLAAASIYRKTLGLDKGRFLRPPFAGDATVGARE